MPVPMNIGIDFDDTYTYDPVLFTEFINYSRERGHRVYIVTMRPPEDLAMLKNIIVPEVDGIYTTDLQAKRPFMEARGINIDVWIDDRPKYVDNPHRYAHEAGTRQRRAVLVHN